MDDLNDLWQDPTPPGSTSTLEPETFDPLSSSPRTTISTNGYDDATNAKPLSALLAKPRNAVARYREVDATPCVRCGAYPPATGRVPFKTGSTFTIPCPDCVGRARAKLAEYDWTRDPSFGTCPKCSRLLFIDHDGRLATNCDNCPGTEERESDAAYAKRARVPIRYADCRVGNWIPATGSPRQKTATFTASWPPAKNSLTLEGPTGTGKTHLAIGAIFDAWTRHRAFGQFWPVIDLLERFRRTMQGDRAQETSEQIEAALMRVDLLVLDDLGAQRDTDYASERLFSIIDLRYSRRLATIVTTNVTMMELPDRVRSRLAHGELAVCRGEDHRYS